MKVTVVLSEIIQIQKDTCFLSYVKS
jgi:hypothetical protein